MRSLPPVRMTMSFSVKNNEVPCHRERSERSHRLRGATPWIVAATRCAMDTRRVLPMKPHVIVNSANDLTDCAVQRHGASPQHGVSWTHAAFLHENPVIVSGANDLAGCAVQCHRSLPQQGAPWNAMPCSEIPPSGQDDNEGSLGYAVPCLPMPCGEIPPSGQDDMDVRCVPTMNIHETPCHRERSERSHRLSSTTP
jgi:hypothetical protein